MYKVTFVALCLVGVTLAQYSVHEHKQEHKQEHHYEHKHEHHHEHKEEPKHEHKHEHIVVDYYTHPEYKFEYAVHDPHTHDVKKHEESRKDHKVKGFYSLHEADGTIRTVHYEADKKEGFNAKVHRSGHAKHPIVGTSKETFYKHEHHH